MAGRWCRPHCAGRCTRRRSLRASSGWLPFGSDHPDVSVGVGERTGIAPGLLPRRRDHCAAGRHARGGSAPRRHRRCWLRQSGRIRCTRWVPCRGRRLSDSKPPARDEHHAQAVVERELQRFRDAVLGAVASCRAQRSAILWNRPPDLISSMANRAVEYRNGIVMCATTSRTRHPAHKVGRSHASAGSPARTSANARRSAAISAGSSLAGTDDVVIETAGLPG